MLPNCRFNNKHTGERIASLLTAIHVAYEFEDKIVTTVTDNASNFRKAFLLYGVKRKNVDCCDSLIQHAVLTNNSSDDDDTGTNLEIGSCPGYNGYVEDSSSEEEDNLPDRSPTIHVYQLLPRHLRCASHTLSLCVTVDAVKAMRNSPELSMIHALVLKKCNRLWNCAARPKSAEIMKKSTGPYSFASWRDAMEFIV
jgi:hypothetical protein